MPHETATRWQFSLRSVLVATTLLSILLVVARYVGAEITLQILFVLASVSIPWLLTRLVRRWYLTAYATVYGPFFLMATYTLLFVECSHCKQATWSMLPFGPGLISLMFARNYLGIDMDDEWSWLVASAAFSAVLLSGECWLLVKLGPWGRFLVGMCVLAFMTLSAYGLLCLIRA